MRKQIESCLQDSSSEHRFSFSLTCTECGERWQSTPQSFVGDAAMLQVPEKQILLQKLFERERQQAIHRAVDEAVQHFNTCPLCGRLVCNRCFVITETLDMCRSCADYLQQSGQAVLSGTADPRAEWEPAFDPPAALRAFYEKLR
ncbi:MAG: hypothetical protein IKV55_04620 [Oscillospiraceae bacterium]|nr:hypothetical protein [Oscillospiraceae bacterium]